MDTSAYENLVFEAYLPPEIRGVEYMRNSHYIKLTYQDKSTVKLYAKPVQQGKCPKCDFTIYTETYLEDMACPKCQSIMEWTWGEARVSFIPGEK